MPLACDPKSNMQLVRSGVSITYSWLRPTHVKHIVMQLFPSDVVDINYMSRNNAQGFFVFLLRSHVAFLTSFVSYFHQCIQPTYEVVSES